MTDSRMAKFNTAIVLTNQRAPEGFSNNKTEAFIPAYKIRKLLKEKELLTEVDAVLACVKDSMRDAEIVLCGYVRQYINRRETYRTIFWCKRSRAEIQLSLPRPFRDVLKIKERVNRTELFGKPDWENPHDNGEDS